MESTCKWSSGYTVVSLVFLNLEVIDLKLPSLADAAGVPGAGVLDSLRLVDGPASVGEGAKWACGWFGSFAWVGWWL